LRPDGPSLLVGVDGGNTKTVALVAAPDGTIIGSGRAGRSDIYNSASIEAALGEVKSATTRALSAAGAAGADVAAACLGLAGADWPEDFELLRGELQPRLELPSPPLILNDAIAPIRAGSTDGVGVSVVIGTYGVAGARNPRGEVFHLGFWPDSTGARPLGSGLAVDTGHRSRHLADRAGARPVRRGRADEAAVRVHPPGRAARRRQRPDGPRGARRSGRRR
jgi:N-acetylglucosamine kinase-like BadF-type ATPase